jgi:hypothetical protein
MEHLYNTYLKNTKFQIYKFKEERSYRVVVKNIHYCINSEEIKTEIEKLGHTVTDIWNNKRYRTKPRLSMLLVELKPASNIKDIFYVK